MEEQEKKVKKPKINLKKPAGRKSSKYPSRTAINLVYQPSHAKTDILSLVMFGIFLIVLAVFTKFMVIDLIAEVNAEERAYHQKERQLKEMIAANEEYDEVEGEYSRYGVSYMTEEELDRQYRTAMLEVIDEKISRSYGFKSISLSGNTAVLTFEVDELRDVSNIVGSLNSSPLVSYVTFSTAVKNEERVERRDVEGNTVVESVRSYLTANITVYFKTLTDSTEAMTEEGGEA